MSSGVLVASDELRGSFAAILEIPRDDGRVVESIVSRPLLP